MDKTLRFYARGTALVPDFAAMDRALPLRRFIGRKYKEVKLGQWGFEPKAEAEEVSTHFNEYVKACQAGDLTPADKETANYCGVEFEAKSADKKSKEQV